MIWLILFALFLWWLAGKPFQERFLKKLVAHAERQDAAAVARAIPPWGALKISAKSRAIASGPYVEVALRCENNSDCDVWIDDILVGLKAANDRIPDGAPKRVDSVGRIPRGTGKDFRVVWERQNLESLRLPLAVHAFLLLAHKDGGEPQPPPQSKFPLPEHFSIVGKITEIV